MSFEELIRLWSDRGVASLREILRGALLIPLDPWPTLALGRTTSPGLAAKAKVVCDLMPSPSAGVVRLVHTNVGDQRPAAMPVFAAAKSGRNPYANVTIGRAPQSDVVIECMGLSRFHADIHCAAGVYTVRDTESRHGTTLNGVKVFGKRGEQIYAGDVVSFGDAACAFVPLEEEALQLVLSRAVPTPRTPAARGPSQWAWVSRRQ